MPLLLVCYTAFILTPLTLCVASVFCEAELLTRVGERALSEYVKSEPLSDVGEID